MAARVAQEATGLVAANGEQHRTWPGGVEAGEICRRIVPATMSFQPEARGPRSATLSEPAVSGMTLRLRQYPVSGLGAGGPRARLPCW